jgi:hypothetical protein
MIKIYYRNGKPYKVNYKYKKKTPKTPEEKRKLFEMRFWLKVNIKKKEECWEWLGYISDGSAIIYYCRKGILARKVAWELHNKKEVPNGLKVLNSCKNHLCCNPDHLYLRNKKVKTNASIKEKKPVKKFCRIF